MMVGEREADQKLESSIDSRNVRILKINQSIYHISGHSAHSVTAARDQWRMFHLCPK